MDHFVSLPLSSRSLEDTSKLGGIALVQGDDGEESGEDPFSSDSMEVGWIGIERKYAV